jgi:hypothetical protein
MVAMAHASSTSSSSSQGPTLPIEHRSSRTEPPFDINLPYQTVSPEANLNEYTVETRSGEIWAPTEKNGGHQFKLVTFLPNDPENPKNWSKAFK